MPKKHTTHPKKQRYKETVSPNLRLLRLAVRVVIVLKRVPWQAVLAKE
jgi:hypothetical protein